MIILGITGSIGMGKSTATEMLREIGLPVLCSDKIVHKLLDPNGDGVKPVAALYPAALDQRTGGINRKSLRGIIGYDHKQWDNLQAVLHPLVREEQRVFLEAEFHKGSKIAVLDIPLLFETQAQRRMNYTICMTAKRKVQRERVLARPHASEEDFMFRMARQMPDWKKRWKANFVVRSDKGLDHTRAALEAIVKKITPR